MLVRDAFVYPNPLWRDRLTVKDCLVYISGPISPMYGRTTEQHLREGMDWYLELFRRGIPSFLPHFTVAAIEDRDYTPDYELCMAIDYAVMRRCTHMLMMPRYLESRGALLELEYARERLPKLLVAFDLAQLEAMLDAAPTTAPDHVVDSARYAMQTMLPKETINHPAHYGGADNPYEAIKVIEAWELGFHLGNTAKYISRAGKKGAALEDLKKAAWYLQREIERCERNS